MSPVTKNIRQAVFAQAWHRKVMIGDPELSKTQAQQVLTHWQHLSFWGRFNTCLARIVMYWACLIKMRHVKVYGRKICRLIIAPLSSVIILPHWKIWLCAKL